MVASSCSSFAFEDYEKIVDLERSWVILNYQLPAVDGILSSDSLQNSYSTLSGNSAHELQPMIPDEYSHDSYSSY